MTTWNNVGEETANWTQDVGIEKTITAGMPIGLSLVFTYATSFTVETGWNSNNEASSNWNNQSDQVTNWTEGSDPSTSWN